MTDHLPRMTGGQIRQVLAAVERRKHADAPYPDCFVCGEPVAGQVTGPWVGSEGEALRTVRPCGHRMTYNLEAVEQIKRQMEAEAPTETAELDKTRRYLRPVRATIISDDPDGVHLAVYSWLEMFDAWATGPGICGESMSQGALPEGTAVTCAGCLARQADYERYLAPGYRREDDDPEELRAKLERIRAEVRMLCDCCGDNRERMGRIRAELGLDTDGYFPEVGEGE